MKNKYGLAAFLTCLILALDQLAKGLVNSSLPLHASKTMIPGLFDVVNIRNRGAAFGFLNRSDIEWQFWFFMGATVLAVSIIVFMLKRSDGEPLLSAGLGMILGGAAGNFIDRVRYRAVVDFLDFYVGSAHWPAFNVADMGICIGAGLVCISALRTGRRKVDE